MDFTGFSQAVRRVFRMTVTAMIAQTVKPHPANSPMFNGVFVANRSNQLPPIKYAPANPATSAANVIHCRVAGDQPDDAARGRSVDFADGDSCCGADFLFV